MKAQISHQMGGVCSQTCYQNFIKRIIQAKNTVCRKARQICHLDDDNEDDNRIGKQKQSSFIDETQSLLINVEDLEDNQDNKQANSKDQTSEMQNNQDLEKSYDEKDIQVTILLNDSIDQKEDKEIQTEQNEEEKQSSIEIDSQTLSIEQNENNESDTECNEITQQVFIYHTQYLNDKNIAEQIILCLKEFKSELEIYKRWRITSEQLGNLYETFKYDYPELWYLDYSTQKSTLNGLLDETTLQFKYEQYDIHYIKQKQQELEEAYDTFYSEKIKGQRLSTIEKLKAAHDYIIENVQYVSTDNGNDYPHNQDVIGALVNHKCVCAGFASAFKYLCDRIGGLEVIIIAGYTKNDSHAWNMAKVDNEYYHIDVTWDDNKKGNSQTQVSYNYFLIPDFLIYTSRSVRTKAPLSGISLRYAKMFYNGEYVVVQKSSLAEYSYDNVYDQMVKNTNITNKLLDQGAFSVLYTFDFSVDSEIITESKKWQLQLSFKCNAYISCQSYSFTKDGWLQCAFKVIKRYFTSQLPAQGGLKANTAYVFDRKQYSMNEISDQIYKTGVTEYTYHERDKYLIAFYN